MKESLKLLLLDSSETTAEVISGFLTNSGTTAVITQVNSLSEAGIQIGLEPWDLVLCSFDLCDGDPHKLPKLLTEREKDIPIIYFAESAGIEQVASALNNGASDFLSQENLEQLPDSIEHSLHNARKRHEYRLAERALAESQQKYHLVSEYNRHMEFWFNPDGEVIYLSPACEQITGYPVEVFRDNPPKFTEIVHPDDREMVAQHIASCKKSENNDQYEIEFRIIHQNGEERWLNHHCQPLYAQDGTFLGRRGSNSDITSYKKVQADFKKQVKRLAALRQIDLSITGTIDLRKTFDIVLNEVVEHLNADAADIRLLNNETQTLDYAAGRGFLTATPITLVKKLGEGFAGKAALENRTIVIPNIQSETLSKPFTLLQKMEDFLSVCVVPLVSKGSVNGVLEVFHRVPFEPDSDWLNFMETLAGQAAIAVDNARLFMEYQRANNELTLAYDETIEGWARAMELRDYETKGHSLRVSEMTIRLARQLGIDDDEELAQIRRGALLHDIGKMGIPDQILLKPARLNAREWKLMKRHTEFGYEMLLPVQFLRPALDIVRWHHERWDGSGYPDGLDGNLIPLGARIFSLVDVWDALLNERPYKAAWPLKKVEHYLRDSVGSHFDPAVVEAYFEIPEKEDLLQLIQHS